MSLSDEAITKLFKIRKTALEMLRDRGYSVNDDEINITRLRFIESFGENMKRENLEIKTHKQDDPSDQIFVIFPDVQKKVGCAIVKDCIVRMQAENVPRAILVVQQSLTPQAKAAVTAVSRRFLIETFQEAELLVNISTCVLVPQHEVLTKEEAKELVLDKYKVETRQLPRMLVTDPIARYYGLKLGQIVKITRPSGPSEDDDKKNSGPSKTASTYITYRIVV